MEKTLIHMIDRFTNDMILSLDSVTYNDLIIDNLKKALKKLRERQNLSQFFMQLSELMQNFHEKQNITDILFSENYEEISSEHLTTGTYLIETMASFKRMLTNYCLLTGKENSFKTELTNTELDNYFKDFLTLLKCNFKRKMLIIVKEFKLNIEEEKKSKPHVYAIELKKFVGQILNKRAELHSNPDNSDVDFFNEDLCIFNDLLKEAHHLFSLSSGLRWNNSIQLNDTPKSIKVISFEDKKHYSSHVMVTKPNSTDLILAKKGKWLEKSPRYHNYQFTLNELQSVNKQPLLENCEIDNYTKIYIDGHCDVGAPYIMDDEGNRLYYDQLAESLSHMFTPEQQLLLQDENNYQHLTIRLLGCSAGKGNNKDSTDSFAANLQRELKDQYGIYSTVIANTRTNFYGTYTIKNMKTDPSFISNTKYGHDERLFFKHLKYTSSIYNNSKKYRKAWSIMNNILVSKQPGSKVIYSWMGEEQIRECAFKGGKWRIQVYELLIDFIDKSDKSDKSSKIEGYTRLLYDLHELDEDEILTKLQDILNDENESKKYNIKKKSRSFLSSHSKTTDIYSALDNLVEKRIIDINHDNNFTLK